MENTFGDFLKQKRQEKKLTQKELSSLLFVSESAVSKWEKNVAHPDITLLPKLCEILGVSEHELITASIDKKTRQDKVEAKKWRTLSFSWSLFFYISYIIALIPCFICNLAIDKTLSWFWIVLSALVLSFTFTNLPQLIKKHKLLILPASMYGALVLLLGVCSIYTKGNWFFIPVVAVLFALIVVFAPIFISKYKVFKKIKKYNNFISVAIDFVLLNILLITINIYCTTNGFSMDYWCFYLGLPISLVCYVLLNILMCVKFLKVNKLIKTSIILYFINLFYLVVPFIKKQNQYVQSESNDFNIFNANLSIWKVDLTLEPNINLIIFLTLLCLATLFLGFGILKYFIKKSKQI